MSSNLLRAAIALGLVWLVSVGQVHSERIPLPEGVFYYQPASSVFGTEAAWVNPAGLGFFRTNSLQFMGDYSQGQYARSWGFATSRDGTAFAYRTVHNSGSEDYKEYLFATGMLLGNLGLGGSYRYFKSGPDGFDGRHFWNIGLSGRGGKLSYAALFSNLNRVRLGDERSEREYRYSLSYRPGSYKLTLSADMFLSAKTKLSNAHYIYNVQWIPVNGLFVDGYLDSDKNFQIGIRANLLEYFVGSKSSFDKNSHNGRTTIYVGAINGRQASLIPPRGRRLSLGLSGSVSENPPRPFFGPKRTAFITLIQAIYRAADDRSISEMVLNLKGLSIGFGRAQELRQAIEHFRGNGKRVTCHISRAGNLTYFVASTADQILMDPVGQLRLVGLRAELSFYGGTLGMLGVNIDMIRIGDHKTATETFTRRASSTANREQINRLLDDQYDQFVTTIAGGRSLSVDSIRGIIDRGPFTSEEAMSYGLVDGLSYRDEVKKNFLSRLPEVSFKKYLSDTLMNDGWPEKPLIAVVVAEGEIANDRGGLFSGSSGRVTPGSMRKAFRSALRNRLVKGVVLRINSPGGLALAGDEIHHTIDKLAAKKPLVVSMSNVAASGGYYVAMPSRKLFANPGSITGSIGIYGGKADFSGLYEMIDLGKELYTRGKFAGMLSTVRPFTDEEHDKFLSHLQAFYDHFLSLVADNRSLSTDSIDNLARGRVWTGREALANGLVDSLGGLKQTLDYSAAALGLDDYRVVIYPQKRPLFVLPAQSMFSTLARAVLGSRNPAASLADELDLPPATGIYARMPFDISIE